MISGDSVQNEVEAASVLLHLVRIAGDDDLVCSEAERVFLLVGRRREDDDVGSQRMGKLHAHVTQPAKTDHANFLARGDAPVPHWRVSSDASAKQRSGSRKLQVRGNA